MELCRRHRLPSFSHYHVLFCLNQRYCVPNGEYVIELIDVDLFASRQKHASIAVIYGGTVKRGHHYPPLLFSEEDIV